MVSCRERAARSSRPVRLFEKIHSGNYGVVFELREKKDRRENKFAVKTFLDDSPISPLEIQIMTQVRHKTLLHALGVEKLQEHNHECPLMDLVVIMPRFPYTLVNVRKTARTVSYLLSDLIDAVTHLHKVLYILHLDIKPENILIERSGSRSRAVLTDFGLSLQVDPSMMRVFSPRRRITDNYTPPELKPVYNPGLPVVGVECIDDMYFAHYHVKRDFRRGFIYSEASDIYSVGKCVAYMAARWRQNPDFVEKHTRLAYAIEIMTAVQPEYRTLKIPETVTVEMYHAAAERNISAKQISAPNPRPTGKCADHKTDPSDLHLDTMPLTDHLFPHRLFVHDRDIDVMMKTFYHQLLTISFDVPLTVFVFHLQLLSSALTIDLASVVMSGWVSLKYVTGDAVGVHLVACGVEEDVILRMESDFLLARNGMVIPTYVYYGNIQSVEQLCSVYDMFSQTRELPQEVTNRTPLPFYRFPMRYFLQ